MYTLSQPLTSVKGIGPVLAEAFGQKNISSIKDLLLTVPLRYEDASLISTIEDAVQNPDKILTIKATVKTVSQYYKNRKTILNATIEDETGTLKCMWFNNKFLKQSLKKDEWFYFSGKVNERGYFMQPRVEKDKEETIHTGRLVPLYTSTLGLQQGKIRTILKEIIDHLPKPGEEKSIISNPENTLNPAFTAIHFPDSEEAIVQAREALALEELLAVIDHSTQLKDQWKENKTAFAIKPKKEDALIPDTIPFELTNAQKRSLDEIMADISKETAMNRLLIGDVGSGKTVVAGVACMHTLQNGKNAALVAPTQILAEQHAQTLEKLFPNIPVCIVTAKTKKNLTPSTEPTLYVGTHAVINAFELIQPALVIFDEQHRFGVNQRSQSLTLDMQPHILSMTATPIPRSLMLTLFSHLEMSVIDELPKGRIPVKTWLVPEKKRTDSIGWMVKQLQQNPKNLAIIVCPFIDPSNHVALENIASAKDLYTKTKKQVDALSDTSLTTALLHGKLAKKKKDTLIQQLFSQKINVLVTTPIVEVGIDLPTANIIVIEAAERFGMASLHQLRGRVGRAGQESYCLLFTSDKSASTTSTEHSEKTIERLTHFTQENNGIKLAEQDLKNRGAGNIFGVQQHGMSNLRFASWANSELIAKASTEYTIRITQPNWQPLIPLPIQKNTDILAN